MREYNLHFYTSYPCNVFINGELIGLIDNKECFFIDISSTSASIIVSVESLSVDDQLLLPYSFKIVNSNGKLTCSSNNVKLVPFTDDHYDIYLDFKQINTSLKSSIASHKIDKYTILSMLDSQSTISVYIDEKNIHTCTCAHIKDIEYEKINNIVIVKANLQSKIYIIAINSKDDNVVLSDTFDSIEKVGDIIKVLKNENSALLTGTVTSLNTKSNDIEKYNVYLDNYSDDFEYALIPYAFLEAVKDENFKIANNYLRDVCSDEKLKQYFGNIKKIYYNCYIRKPNVVNYTIYGQTYKNFDFYIENKKIIDIEENIL